MCVLFHDKNCSDQILGQIIRICVSFVFEIQEKDLNIFLRFNDLQHHMDILIERSTL